MRQHGTAGRAFVGALRRNPAEFYERQFAQVRDAVGSIACGHPQADNIALLAFADALAEYYVFAPGTGWQACLDGALSMALWAFGNATGAEGGDTDLKAIQFLAEWLVGNKIHFDDYCENDRLERWGAIEEKGCAAGFYWFVFSSVLERALSSGNFDRAKTLRRMDEEGLLVCDSGHRYTKQKRFRNAGGSTASASTTRRWRRFWSARRLLPPSSRLKAARHVETGLRRPYRLVRVRIHGARLNVFTGRRNEAATRAGARARTGARGVGAGLVETLRRLAFRLAAGRFPRLTQALRRRWRRSCGHETRREGAAMSWWTEEQDDVLREVSFRGAEFAAAEIERRCGVHHSVRAVEMRASRIHCSLAVQTVCPECGAGGREDQPADGHVPPVHRGVPPGAGAAFNEQLERERAHAEDAADIDDVRRERDRMRQRNSRLRRKYGLKGKRERGG